MIVVTGSAGLVGSEVVRLFSQQNMPGVGIDNDFRRSSLGESGSTAWLAAHICEEFSTYTHHEIDLRNHDLIRRLFEAYGSEIDCIVHAAAQPSHEWAARNPQVDYEVNVGATLNLLECVRTMCPQAVFIFCSSSKVYGEHPNTLPLHEGASRWNVDKSHPYGRDGIDETMTVDQTLHSVYGANKLAADLIVQEYARYFGLRAGCFRLNCITGPHHSAVEMHGFIAYLMMCAISCKEYYVFGYGGKQVRDNLHARDVARAFHMFYMSPEPGGGFNLGGSWQANCSILEAVRACEIRVGRSVRLAILDEHRKGDHIWWITDNRRFCKRYPAWQPQFDMEQIYDSVYEGLMTRLSKTRR